jgi:hypothetical protein
MRKSRYQGVKVPKRIDVSKLHDSNVREDLQKALEDEQYDGTWDKFKTEVYNASVAVLGLKADFQSSHEAPRSSLRVMHEHFHPITMLNSSF